jgi:hypothetical protein
MWSFSISFSGVEKGHFWAKNKGALSWLLIIIVNKGNQNIETYLKRSFPCVKKWPPATHKCANDHHTKLEDFKERVMFS